MATSEIYIYFRHVTCCRVPSCPCSRGGALRYCTGLYWTGHVAHLIGVLGVRYCTAQLHSPNQVGPSSSQHHKHTCTTTITAPNTCSSQHHKHTCTATITASRTTPNTCSSVHRCYYGSKVILIAVSRRVDKVRKVGKVRSIECDPTFLTLSTRRDTQSISPYCHNNIFITYLSLTIMQT
jgi:hypothetical protein